MSSAINGQPSIHIAVSPNLGQQPVSSSELFAQARLPRSFRVRSEDDVDVSLRGKIEESLPPGTEYIRHTPYRIKLPQDSRQMIVTYVGCSGATPSSLANWEQRFAERYGRDVFAVPRKGSNTFVSYLRDLVLQRDTITKSDWPRIRRAFDELCGTEPQVPSNCEILFKGRRDLTDLKMVAIDPVGTKDREDAIHVARLNNGCFKVTIGIIDVTDWVSPGDSIDQNARKLGATMYGRSRAWPTLGREVAYGLGSFVPGDPRPAWIIELFISKSGVITNLHTPNVYRGIVKVDRNLSPAEFDDTEFVRGDPQLSAISEVARLLRSQRFNSRQVIRIDNDTNGEQVVGELMIPAYAAIGSYFNSLGVPAIYRVHTRPTPLLIRQFIDELNSVGIPAIERDLHSMASLSEMLRFLSIKGSRDCQVLRTKLLDAFLERGWFSPENFGHYALAQTAYAPLKARDSAGLTNQFVLNSLHSDGPALSKSEITERSEVRNAKDDTRDARVIRMHLLEDLLFGLNKNRFAHTGYTSILHPNGELELDLPKLKLRGFIDVSKQTGLEDLKPNQRVAVTIIDFDLKRMKFRCELLASV